MVMVQYIFLSSFSQFRFALETMLQTKFFHPLPISCLTTSSSTTSLSLVSMRYMSASTISSSVTFMLQMHLQTSSPSEFVMRVTVIFGFAISAAGGGGVGFGVGAASALSTSVFRVRLRREMLFVSSIRTCDTFDASVAFSGFALGSSMVAIIVQTTSARQLITMRNMQMFFLMSLH